MYLPASDKITCHLDEDVLNKMTNSAPYLTTLAIVCLAYVTVTEAKVKGSDSDECWACTDMAASLCKKEVRNIHQFHVSRA